MGKSIAIALPFIIFILLVLFVLVYRVGKRVGQNEVPRRNSVEATQLLYDADRLFHRVTTPTSLDDADILSTESRTKIDAWRSKFEKAKNL
jgi:hypothetical protein